MGAMTTEVKNQVNFFYYWRWVSNFWQVIFVESEFEIGV